MTKASMQFQDIVLIFETGTMTIAKFYCGYRTIFIEMPTATNARRILLSKFLFIHVLLFFA